MLCPRHCALPEPPSASGRTWIWSGGWTDFRLVPSEVVSKGATGASRTACRASGSGPVMWSPTTLHASSPTRSATASTQRQPPAGPTSSPPPMRVALSGRSSNTLPDGLSGLRLRAEELDDAEVIIAVHREEIRAGVTSPSSGCESCSPAEARWLSGVASDGGVQVAAGRAHQRPQRGDGPALTYARGVEQVGELADEDGRGQQVGEDVGGHGFPEVDPPRPHMARSSGSEWRRADSTTALTVRPVSSATANSRRATSGVRRDSTRTGRSVGMACTRGRPQCASPVCLLTPSSSGSTACSSRARGYGARRRRTGGQCRVGATFDPSGSGVVSVS